MTRTMRLLCFLLLPLTGLTPVLAGSTDEARQWIEKFAKIYATPFKADFDMKLMAGAEGKLGGTMAIAPDQKMRMNMEMNMKQAGQTMDIKMLVVSDGKDVWLDMNIPSVGMHQVMTVSLEKAKGMAGMNQAFALIGQDPTSQVKKLAETLDFQVSKQEGGRVTLTANPTREQMEALGDGIGTMPADFSLSKIVFELDEKSIMPMSVIMSNDTSNIMEMNFSKYQKLSSEEVATSFSYTPPEGVEVMDMNKMVPQGAGQ